MGRTIITVFFDNDWRKSDEEREYDRFILETNNFKKKLLEIFEQKRYSWNEPKEGYKNVMEIHQINITDLEIFTDNSPDDKALKQEGLLKRLKDNLYDLANETEENESFNLRLSGINIFARSITDILHDMEEDLQNEWEMEL
ncbi:hypothetical protein [Xylanivirga thermophila]|uniref:hypothetical protein n=1 Tax=Xylanivirga thermophila TaxID=2496273 RepID=UPI00101C309B|nr:hypothetical protein [Xylanivirga thermophila]